MQIKFAFILTVLVAGVIIKIMKKIEIAKMLGLNTRQHVDLVLSGKSNFSYSVAKKATVLIGGSLEVWQDKDRVDERRRVWGEFKQKIEQAEGK